METREQAAARARKYRVRKKKEEINARDRKRWKEKRRYDRRAKTIEERSAVLSVKFS